MPIIVACGCGKKYSVGDDAAGKSVKCKQCGAVLKVPGGAKKSTAVVKAPPKPAAPKPPEPKKEDSYDFADSDPKPPEADGDVFQGPSPDELPGAAPDKKVGATAALYGQDTGSAARGAAAKKKNAKGNLVMWGIIGGVILLIFVVLKFFVVK